MTIAEIRSGRTLVGGRCGEYHHAMERPLFRTRYFLIGVMVTLLLVSLIAWPLTVSAPGRFIFLPGGDVGLGFRSFAGNLEWIEYAPWMGFPGSDYVKASLPWWLVCPCEGIVVWWLWTSTMRLRTRWRVFKGLCPKCEYDLRGHLDAGCPECGWRREVKSK